MAPLGPEVLVTSSVAPDLPHLESTKEKRPAPPSASLPEVMGEIVSVLLLPEDECVSLGVFELEEGVAAFSGDCFCSVEPLLSLDEEEEELVFFLHVPRARLE